METEEVKLKIFRYDPTKDEKTRYEVYSVPWRLGLTVLDALNHIKEYTDSSLSFRQGCRSEICGSCALRVDKRKRLACRTQITERMAANYVVIDPLNHFKVIKDLVVDLEPFYERTNQIQHCLVRDNITPVTEKEMAIPTGALKEAKSFRECILCGSCYSGYKKLDVEKLFCGPSALIKTMSFVTNPRDEIEGRLAQAVEPENKYI